MFQEHYWPYLSYIQGLYYVITGIWPLIAPVSFQKITGPKIDFWPVNTVGSLIGVVEGVLIVAAARKAYSWEIFLLALGSAIVLAIIDIYYVIRKRISAIYLADAIAEIILISLWLWHFAGTY